MKMGKRVDEPPYEWPEVRLLRVMDGIDPVTGYPVPNVHGDENEENSKAKERQDREAKERERE